MKLLPKHYDYILPIYIPIFFIALSVVFFFPHIFLISLRAHWLLLFFLIFLALSPIGKIRLGNPADSQSKFFLLLLIVAQLAITFIYLGMVYIVFWGLPTLAPQQAAVFLPKTADLLIINSGAYPWALFLLLGIGLAYLSYPEHKPGKFSLLTQSILKNTAEDSTSLIIDFFIRTIAHFSLALTIGIITLYSVTFFAKLLHMEIITGLRFLVLATATAFLILMNLNQWKLTFRWLLHKKIPLIIIASLFIASVTIILLIINYFTPTLVQAFPQMTTTLVPFKISDWFTNWQLLSAIWWLAWIPLLSGLIAYVARGHTIRKVILIGLLGLMINSILIKLLLQPAILENLTGRVIFQLLPWIGFFIIASIFLRQRFQVFQMRAVVPDTQAQKKRSLVFYTQAFFQSALFVIILYLPAGIFVLNIWVVIMIFPLAVISILLCAGTLKTFIRKL